MWRYHLNVLKNGSNANERSLSVCVDHNKIFFTQVVMVGISITGDEGSGNLFLCFDLYMSSVTGLVGLRFYFPVLNKLTSFGS